MCRACLEEREKEQAAKLEALRAAVHLGIEELDRGEYREFADSRSLEAYTDSLAPKARTSNSSR